MRNKAAAALISALFIFGTAGCGEKVVYENSMSAGTSSSAENDSADENTKPAVINTDEMAKILKDVPDLDGEGPQLFLSNTTAKAGEYAEVTLSVKNAENKWNMCGIHVIYPEVLKPEMSNPEEREVKFTKGSALELSTGYVCMEWQEGLPPVLTKNKKGCLFFTCMFTGNQGLDGDIATFYLKIPDNAESGAVYDLGCYYSETDLFSNEQNIPSFQKYAFEHFQGGTITVE